MAGTTRRAPEMTPGDLRSRVYQYYATARHESLAPATIADFESRGPYLRAMIRRHFPADREAMIVDLGCGHGAAILAARRAGYRNVHGVDRSPEQVAEAHRLGITGVEEGDILQTLALLASDSHDVVLTFDVIEHLTRDELVGLTDHVHRVLKPGGRWIIHAPNGESPLVGRIRYGDLTHEQAFTRTSIGQLLLSSGFRTVECYEDVPIVHGAKSAARFLVWKLVRTLLRVYLAAETGRVHQPAIFSQNLLAVAVK